ncbi:MAG: tetratricopeptide repeat protein [Candidatus Obscuribacterales bacterium]|nr:tetratricopeptide repeat protein [Candidatus Obscuribacterales bacterium]
MKSEKMRKAAVICIVLVLLDVIVLSVVASSGLVQRLQWESEFMKFTETLAGPTTSETLPGLQRLVDSADEYHKPYVRNLLTAQYCAANDWPKIEESAQKNLEEFVQNKDVGGQVSVLCILAACANQHEDTSQAEAYFNRALQLLGSKDSIEMKTLPLLVSDIMGLRFPLPSQDKQSILCEIATIKKKQGKIVEAEELYKKAIDTSDTLKRTHALTAYSKFLTQQDRTEEAKKLLLSEEKSISEASTEENGDEVRSMSMHCLGYQRESAGNLPEALRLYKKTAQMIVSQSGDQSGEYIECLADIARILEKSGKIAEAEDTYKQAYKLATRADHNKQVTPTTRGWRIIHAATPLADFYYQKKQFKKAEQYYRESIAQSTARYKEAPIGSDFDWLNLKLADCLVNQNKPTEAEEIYKRAVAEVEKNKIGELYKYEVFNGYSRCLAALQRDDEAAEFLTKAKAEKRKSEQKQGRHTDRPTQANSDG